MRSVFRPRIANAAARLTAVVVLPTPPFWLAIATIIGQPPLDVEAAAGRPLSRPRRTTRDLHGVECQPQSAIPGRGAPIVGMGRNAVNRQSQKWLSGTMRRD